MLVLLVGMSVPGRAATLPPRAPGIAARSDSLGARDAQLLTLVRIGTPLNSARPLLVANGAEYEEDRQGVVETIYDLRQDSSGTIRWEFWGTEQDADGFLIVTERTPLTAVVINRIWTEEAHARAWMRGIVHRLGIESHRSRCLPAEVSGLTQMQFGDHDGWRWFISRTPIAKDTMATHATYTFGIGPTRPADSLLDARHAPEACLVR